MAVVGSRKVTAYGRIITERLVRSLVQAGVVIVSGLAVGVDGIAHRAALEAGGTTIAVLPGGLDNIYPAIHRTLAQDIVRRGGSLLSEYGAGTTTFKQNFIARNRIVSGISDGVLITEAALKSGTLHTARFGLEQGKEVMAVPGDITRPSSEGTNNLLKAGALLVHDARDVLHALGIPPTEAAAQAASHSREEPNEQLVLTLIGTGLIDGNALLTASELPTADFNQALTMLELSGEIRALGGNQWSLR